MSTTTTNKSDAIAPIKTLKSKLNFNFQELKESLIEVLFRFPLAVLSCVLFSFISIAKVPQIYELYRSMALNVLFAGCFWMIAGKLFLESRLQNRNKNLSFTRHTDFTSNPDHVANSFSTSFSTVNSDPVTNSISIKIFHTILTNFLILVAMIGIAYYQIKYLTSYAFFPISILLGISAILLMLLSPFLNKNSSKENIWVFTFQIISRVLFTILVSTLLYVGIISSLATFYYLFGIEQNSGLYIDIWTLIAMLFAPIVAMMGIPKNFDTAPNEKMLRPISNLLTYIIIPLLLIYAAILYLYMAKIGISFALPKGNVAYLVSIFGLCSLLAYLMSDVDANDSSKMIEFYKKHLFKILILPLVLLGVGITIRIKEYGMTEDRYFVLLCLVFLSLTCLGGFFFKRNLSKFVLIISPALIFISIIGPQNAFTVSSKSQINQLENRLLKNKILQNGSITQQNEKLSKKEYDSINSIVSYMIFSGKKDALLQWMSDRGGQNIVFKNQVSINEIMSLFAINYIEADDKNKLAQTKTTQFFSYSYKNFGRFFEEANDSNYPIRLSDINIMGEILESQKSYILEGIENPILITFNPNTYEYKIQQQIQTKKDSASKNQDLIVCNLKDLVKKLGSAQTDATVNEQLTFFAKNDQISVKLIIDDLSGNFDVTAKEFVLYNLKSSIQVKNN